MLDYSSIAVSRLAGQFENSPKLKSLISEIVSTLSIIENNMDSIVADRWIETSIGKQLDGIGGIVGEPRQGRNDDSYRLAIKFRIFVNISKGTPIDLVRGLKFLTDPTDCQYLEAYPATAFLFTNSFFVNKKINYELQQIAPAGISNITVAVSFADKPFRFSKGSIPGELFVNNKIDYLTANGSDIKVTQTSAPVGLATLGGVVPAELDVGGSYLDVGNATIAVYNQNKLNTIGHFNLTGVFQ